MLITNLDQVPGRKVKEILGTVIGHSTGDRTDSGDHGPVFQDLFRKAEERLKVSASRMGAQAIIGLEGRSGWDPDQRPEMTLIGTAVSLESDDEEEEEGISLSMDGNESQWSIPPASPSDEVAMLIKQRERSDRKQEKERKDIYDLADEIGISYDRAKLLIDSGYRDLEDIADTTSRDIARIDGINPTQARILRKKAKEIIDKEREL
jgi:uncharacterized protein YbjQ (UPF0145 family)/predicted flap endonuclease-1-like 5' DNA nuclease